MEDVASCLRPLLADPDAQRAMQVRRDDYLRHDGIGPRRVSLFLHGEPDDATQADVVGLVTALLAACEA